MRNYNETLLPDEAATSDEGCNSSSESSEAARKRPATNRCARKLLPNDAATSDEER